MNDIDTSTPGGSPKKFRLDRRDGKIAGVCGGLAKYLGVDPTIVRVVFAIGAIAGVGTFVLLYLGIWLLAD